MSDPKKPIGVSLAEQTARLVADLTPKERELLAAWRKQLDEDRRNRQLDTERLNWLDSRDDRVEDVRGRMINEDETAREAIDFFRNDHAVVPGSAPMSQTGRGRDAVEAEAALRKAIRDLPALVGDIERGHMFNLLDKVVMP